MANFAERIKELRTETGLTQEQLAEKVGATRMTIIRWERGDNIPTEDNLLFLARLFKVSVYYLLGYTDDREMIAAEGNEETESRGEKADEERLLNRYRLLTPDMKKMIHAVINNATEKDRIYITEQETVEWKTVEGWLGELEECLDKHGDIKNTIQSILPTYHEADRGSNR